MHNSYGIIHWEKPLTYAELNSKKNIAIGKCNMEKSDEKVMYFWGNALLPFTWVYFLVVNFQITMFWLAYCYFLKETSIIFLYIKPLSHYNSHMDNSISYSYYTFVQINTLFLALFDGLFLWNSNVHFYLVVKNGSI